MKNIVKIICVFSTLLIFLSVLYTPTPTYADELSDLNAQIQAKQKEQQATLKKIKDIDANIRNLSKNTSNLNSLLIELQNQQVELNEQIKTLDQQIIDQDKNLEEFNKILDEKEDNIRQKINYLYKLSYSQPNIFIGSETDLNTFLSERAELNYSISIYKDEIKDYYSKIDLAKQVRDQSEKDKQTASETLNSLAAQIDGTKKQIAQNQAALAAANQSKSSLVAKSNELANQLQFLNGQQQALLNAELIKMANSGQVNQNPLQPGQYYFLGKGRDLIEGHGLGMSQWGAYGMALNNFTFDRILTFYYSGVTIGNYTEPTQIRVPDKANAYPPEAKTRGYLTIDEYLAGIGEVPNSWPAEAVKAQVVAARTYVMGVCGGNTSCQICGTASCQVYNGVTQSDPSGKGKLSFVTATKGKVILYNGAPITAYYSASHRGHSSSFCGVWSGFNSAGNSNCNFSARSYIKPVVDDPYAFKGYYTSSPYNPSQRIYPYTWSWRTNGYTLQELTTIMSRSASLNVGQVQNIEVTKESQVVANGSNRVYRVKIIGSSGTKYLSGWDFRAIFNAATPYNDYIYSTEFGFYQNL